MNDRTKSQLHLLVSREDVAGMNICTFLNNRAQKKVIEVNNISIYSDEELYNQVPSNSTSIFLSRHSARSLRPSFTVHPIGNFGKADFGGKINTLVRCNSFILKRLLLNIKDLVNSRTYRLMYNYEISLEVTHHGPYSEYPVVFIEVGSSEAQWQDLEACRLIAQVVNGFEYEKTIQTDKWTSSIGFGGNHYANKFTKIILETEYSIGHICPKYALPLLNDDLVNQMIMNTEPKPKIAFFDKKSMKRKQEIRYMLVKHDIEVVQI